MLAIRTFDDKKTFDLFSQGDTDGIFQFESGGMKQLLRNLQPDRFDDLIALNALFRPGPLGAGMGETYVNRRHGREPVTYMFPSLEPILAPTYGVILYQEQVMQIASLIAGYSLGEADMLRRAMGKKDFAKMAKEKSKFIDQGELRGYDRAKVSELFDLIEYFAGYGFNKSHSAAYALVAFETAYLKANFRTEFMAGLLSTKSGRTDDVVKYIQNCRELGIEVLGPDINQSELDFTITGPSQIRFGFAAVKGLGEAALEAILAARAQEGGFKDFFHALKATDLQKANRRVWESLIKAGAFDSMEANRAALVAGLPSALENAGKGGVDHRHDRPVRRGRAGQPGRQLGRARGRGALVPQGAPALRAGDPGAVRLRATPWRSSRTPCRCTRWAPSPPSRRRWPPGATRTGTR